MSEWALKRFWTKVDVEEADEGHRVTLDGRRVKTPAKADLVLPTRGMAEAVAEEWKAQEGQVNPLSMPFTRSANAAPGESGVGVVKSAIPLPGPRC